MDDSSLFIVFFLNISHPDPFEPLFSAFLTIGRFAMRRIPTLLLYIALSKIKDLAASQQVSMLNLKDCNEVTNRPKVMRAVII